MSESERGESKPAVAPFADGQPAAAAADQQRPAAETGANSDAPKAKDADATRGTGGSQGKRRPPEHQPVRSLFELLLGVYAPGRKPRVPRALDLAEVQATPKLESDELGRLLGLAASDRTLERTRMLMLTSMERFERTNLAGPIREFVRQVLTAHPVFQSPNLLRVLQNHPDGPDEEDAVRTVTARSSEPLRWPDGIPVLKKNEIARCRTNAVGCLLLWFRESRGTSLKRVLGCLQKSLWTSPARRRQQPDRQKLKTLITARDLRSLSAVCDVFDEQLLEKTQDASTARNAEERATNRAENAEQALAMCQSQLEGAQAETHAANDLLRKEKQQRENDSAHFRDDYGKLRGRLLQRIKEEVSLLDEGLQALRREPPKVHVMVDHAERAIENLKREIERLRGEE